MRVKVGVRETAVYEVWLVVDDPDDREELEAAWTNLDSTTADLGMVGYEDREFEVITTEAPVEQRFDEYIDWLQRQYHAAREATNRLVEQHRFTEARFAETRMRVLRAALIVAMEKGQR